MPVPPYSSSTVRPSRPCSPSFGHSANGNWLVASASAARGAASAAAKWATLWRSRSISSPRSKFRDGTCIAVAPRRDCREWTHPAGERATAGRAVTRTGDGPQRNGVRERSEHKFKN
ncbi:hypothetical protein G6F68_018898 [Rhizopus microsporus]|nr:hypothetical protein G6F68_018898 [Rhizopus microsporus]